MPESDKSLDVELNFYNKTFASFILYDSSILLITIKSFFVKTDEPHKNTFEMTKSMRSRIMESGHTMNAMFDRGTLEHSSEATQRLNSLKLYNDRVAISQVLAKCSLELKKTGTYKKLLKVIANQQNSHSDENKFVSLAINNLVREQSIINNLEMISNQKCFKTYHLSTEVAKIENMKYDNSINKQMKIQFNMKWEAARVELQKKVAQLKLSKWQDEIKRFIYLENREVRVGLNMNTILEGQIILYENMCLDWMQRYDTEIESIDMDLQIIKESIQYKHDMFIKLSEEFVNQQKQIENFINLKKVTKATIKIQAWWRRIIFRLKLSQKKTVKEKLKKPVQGKIKKKTKTLIKGKRK